MATTAAAIDIGSNTIHLSVARIHADGRVEVIGEETQLARLGADVTATGAIGAERAARALRTLRRQVAQARAQGASTILGIATESVRVAANGEAFLAQAREQTGVAFTLVDGEQEAALTYWGAALATETSEVNEVNEDAAGVSAPGGQRGVIDLGGGSVELVVGEGERIAWRVSLPLGSGVIHDRYMPSDPPHPDELARAEAVVAQRLAAVAPPAPVGSVMACGGTAKTLLRVAQLLAGKASGRRRLSEHDFTVALDVLTAESAVTAARFGIEPERARILPAGGIVLREAMRRLGATEVQVSLYGVREGALWAWAQVGDAWPALAARGGVD